MPDDADRPSSATPSAAADPDRPNPLVPPMDPAIESLATAFLRSGGGFLPQAQARPRDAGSEAAPPEAATAQIPPVGFIP